MLANHFHLRLMTMYKCVVFHWSFDEVLEQNLLKTCLSKSFFVKFLKDVWYLIISNNKTIHLNNCHSSSLNTTDYIIC